MTLYHMPSIEEIAKEIEVDLKGPHIARIKDEDEMRDKLNRWHSTQNTNIHLACLNPEYQHKKEYLEQIKTLVENRYDELSAVINTRHGLPQSKGKK